MNTFRSASNSLSVDSRCDYLVVVIGAGPAGSITALQLTRTLAVLGESVWGEAGSAGSARGKSRSVLIVDREDFPRAKVCGCCLNGAAIGALESAGLARLPEELGAVPLTRWQAQIASSGRRPRVTEVPLPNGWAVSRDALDAALLERVRASGAEVRTGVVARILSTGACAVQVELKTAAGIESVSAAAVVVASGLSGGGLESILPWRRSPAGPIGLGTTLAVAENEYEPGTIYMACDRTGYAGLVRLEDGRLDIAAAVYDPSGEGRRRAAGERVAEILRSAWMPMVRGIEGATWRGTPRLHRQRQPGCGRVIAVGDAAGYVEPFTGEGMAWGMQTGVLAARVIAERLADRRPDAVAELGVRYTRQYDRLLSRRRMPCRILTAVLRPTWTRRMLFQTLSAAPWLAGPVVRMLNRAS